MSDEKTILDEIVEAPIPADSNPDPKRYVEYAPGHWRLDPQKCYNLALEKGYTDLAGYWLKRWKKEEGNAHE